LHDRYENPDLADAEGVTDINELNRVLDRAVGLRTFLTADDRVEKVAAFVADHFREKVLPLGYKAFLVGVNREACAKYKRALDKLLPSEWSEAVYSENTADVVDRPLVAELQISDQREADVRLLFKKATEEPKILIVTDKLLTGYDAPILYCMYLDKPMRDHVLLQAIARVNRPYVDANGLQKHVGLVLDFVGVLRELRKALKFDSSDVSGVIEDLDLLLKDFLEKIDKAKADYLEAPDGDNPDERLEKMIYGRFLDQEPRKLFFDTYKEIEALWGAAGISAQQLAQDAESALAKFPNAPVNADERRRLRAALYRPLLGVGKDDRGRLVDLVVAILLGGQGNAGS
jgi:type I restriction enzyme R subunit